MVRRVEKDPSGGWIARDRFGVEYLEAGFRWNSRSGARCVVDEDRLDGDIGVHAFHAARLLKQLVPCVTHYQTGRSA